MVTNPYPGFFIDIEGIDGSGQSTQVTRVAGELKRQDLEVAITRATSTDTPIGQLISQALQHQFEISIQTLEFLFAAGHSDRQEKEIIPTLKRGGMVVADRSVWSFVAFGSLNMDRDWLFELAKNLMCPDLTIFLKVSPQVAMKRIVTYRRIREFFEKGKTLARVWQNYEWISQKFSEKIVMIDGDRPIEEVTREILEIIKEHPKFRKISNIK